MGVYLSTQIRDFPQIGEESYGFEAKGREGIAVEGGNGYPAPARVGATEGFEIGDQKGGGTSVTSAGSIDSVRLTGSFMPVLEIP